MAGIGVAGLLVAGIPAQAQSGSTGSTTSDQSTKGGSSSSQTGSATGSGSSSDQGATGSSSQSGSMMGTGSSGSMMGTGSSTASDTSGMEKSKNELTGKVEKFDRDTKELTLANSDKKLKVSDSTRVMKDGQHASLSDIKEGDQVRASFSGSGDTLQVNRIDVMTAGSMGTGAGETGTTATPPSDTGTGTTTTPPSDTGTGTGTTTTPPPSDTGTGTTGSGSSGATPPPSKGY